MRRLLLLLLLVLQMLAGCSLGERFLRPNSAGFAHGAMVAAARDLLADLQE